MPKEETKKEIIKKEKAVAKEVLKKGSKTFNEFKEYINNLRLYDYAYDYLYEKVYNHYLSTEKGFHDERIKRFIEKQEEKQKK